MDKRADFWDFQWRISTTKEIPQKKNQISTQKIKNPAYWWGEFRHEKSVVIQSINQESLTLFVSISFYLYRIPVNG
ncbi:hypothetical protein ZOSMA_213G00120 [Zostera marina]|uniref:Uncharacterized protein n=1 Tax=Zostera marina TaxID=29655 RepID=A0A0K9PKH3_ZOSMR|nr:hypothetical protein ZOSMA_213G00120 [Zostera marina]